MRKKIKRIFTVLMVLIIFINSIIQIKIEAKATAVVAGLVIEGDTILSLIISGLAMCGIYDLFTEDDYEEYGVTSYNDLSEEQKLSVQEQIQEDYKEIINTYLTPENASTLYPLVQALNGEIDGTSALEEVESALFDVIDCGNNIKKFAGNNELDDDNNIKASVAVSGEYMNRVATAIAECMRSSLLAKYNDLPDLPEDVANYSHYRIMVSVNTGKVLLQCYNATSNYVTNISNHCSNKTCASYETWFTSYKDYKLKGEEWEFEGELKNTGIGGCDTNWKIIYLNHDYYWKNGDLYLSANPYNGKGEENVPSNEINKIGNMTIDAAEDGVIEVDKGLIISTSSDTLIDAINEAYITDTDVVTDEESLSLPLIIPGILDEVTENEMEKLTVAEQAEAQELINEAIEAEEETDTDLNTLDSLDSPGLDDKFPFCIPFDLYNLIKALDAEPVAPKFTIPIIKNEKYGWDYSISVDWSDFNVVAEICRGVEVFCFIFFLIMKTRSLIRG